MTEMKSSRFDFVPVSCKWGLSTKHFPVFFKNNFCLQKLSLLKKLLDGDHDGQLKTMESRHERECADLRKNQVKQSVETSKNAGKQIKCKEEKERYSNLHPSTNRKHFRAFVYV
jgi:hypothetical protein